MSQASINAILILTVTGISAKLLNGSTCYIPPVVEGCNHPDFGSCGNACCGLEVLVPVSPGNAFSGIVQYLQSGGADKSFSYVQGQEMGGRNPPAHIDVPSFTQNGAFWLYAFQGKHTTAGGYIDTLNFNIQNTSSGGSRITAFSISGIHGALQDYGQNYKTLIYMLGALRQTADAKIIYGCGLPASTPPSSQTPAPTPASQTPAPTTVPAVSSPAPTPASTNDHDCPGGKAALCIASCPSDPLDAYSACVNTCASRCP